MDIKKVRENITTWVLIILFLIRAFIPITFIILVLLFAAFAYSSFFFGPLLID